MLLVNNLKLVVISIFIVTNYLSAQVQIGLSLGNNYDFGQNVVNAQQSNTAVNLSVEYKNESILKPSLLIIFSKLPLNYSKQVIKNQGIFKTVIINSSTSIELGLESEIKKLNKYTISGKFGFGITFINNPSLWVENSNEGFGYNTNYTNKSEKSFAFLDLSGKINRKISEKWTVFLSIGTIYYPKDNSVSVSTKIYEQNLEINSTFTKTRPYFNLGLQYSFL